WIAAAYGLNPLYWFESVQALNYVPGSAIATGVAWFAWRATESSRAAIICSAVLLAVGMGIRPDLLLWVGPLVIWSAWTRSRRELALVLGILILAAIAWFAVSRNLYALDDPRLAHTWYKLLNTSIFRLGPIDGAARNLLKLGVYLAWAMGFA